MRADSNRFANPRAAARSTFGRAFCGALLLALGANALSLPGKRFVGQYDFGYAIHGDKLARPAQVFDDGGGKVYFEAHPGQPMPAVFAGKDLALLVLQPEGQYFTARTTASEFTLVLGGARAAVRRGESVLGDETVSAQDDGPRLLASAERGLPAGIDYGAAPPGGSEGGSVHEQPVVFAAGSAVLKPEVLDALSALVVRIGRDTLITATGRSDGGGHGTLATRRAEALRNALLARGIPADNIRLSDADAASGTTPSHASVLRWTSVSDNRTPGAASARPAVSFDIAPGDGDIAVSLRRWARASGYELAWDVDWVAPVDGELRVEATSFLDAVRQVVSGLRAQGYPVQAQAGADRIVRFSAPE